MSDAVPAKWDAKQITSQQGKKVIITGANSGIGYVTALELARHGADVVLACRNEEKGRDAVKQIEEEIKLSPEAGKVEFRNLDVSSLASVQSFADAFKTDNNRLDLLINNAGIMATPYSLTVDGYESQFATNHLGHFALASHLMELLKKSKSARIVNLSSSAHKIAKVDLKEIVTPESKYKKWTVYANSKMYNLLFTRELNRRLQANGIDNVIAAAAHPGVSTTNLAYAHANWFLRQAFRIFFLLPLTQTAEYGALPSLYAAVGENIKPNDYIGPDGFQSMTGYPTKEEPVNVSKSDEYAKVLWEESEKLAKIKFTI